MRTFKLTSPLMHGDDVRALQYQLRKQGYYKDKVDGNYGEFTAQAVYRAKYWLGYPKPDKSAGERLFNLLTGAKKPPARFKFFAARRKRIKAKNPKPLRMKMWEEAGKHIGVKESPPESNRVLFSLWYGVIGPWCAMFLTWVGVKVGSKSFVRHKYWAYCPYMEFDARRGVNGLSITNFPQMGDIILFDWEGDGVPNHTGLFGKWLEDGKMLTREGNTGNTNWSNGGEVQERTDRNKSLVRCFIHVAK